MDLLNNLALGFSVVLTPLNLLYCFLGTVVGPVVGVLPGIGPVATIAMLLPITFNIPPLSALIMLAGVYYGSQYGCSTTSILLNMPGEVSSAVTCIDGYAMARQGRAGPALTVAALGSFFAGCVSILVIALFSPVLTEFALKFGPADYFSLMVTGLVSAVVLARGSVLKASAMVILGLLLGIVGTDVNSSVRRFWFGIPELSDGIGVAVIAMGMFGIAEVISSLERTIDREVLTTKIQLMPTWTDFKASWGAALRGTALGSILGVLPGGGALVSSFASYVVEKRLAADPSRFGKGAIEGVAGPESANNAGAQTSFIPMLTLGLPSNAVMALMLGAMIIQGIAPGPQVMSEKPDLFWGLICSMWIGNVMLLVLNLPMIGLWVKLLKIPYRILCPAILLFCCIGIYSLSNNPFDIFLTAGFGLLGYILVKFENEPAPLLLGFVLGPMMEEYLRRAMVLSRGDATVFFTRPISLVMLLVAASLMITILISPAVRRRREEAFKE